MQLRAGGSTPDEGRRIPTSLRRNGRLGSRDHLLGMWMKLAVLVLFAGVGNACAQENPARGWLHLNGYTHHFEAPDANDNLLGVGATWYVKKWGRIARAWEADLFQDSGRKLSGYVGQSLTYRGRFANAGVTAALMYHRNFAKQNRWSVLPVALPYAELPLGKFSLRAYYIPPLRRGSDQQIAFQVLVPMGATR